MRGARSRLKMRDAQFSSKAYGTREYKEISIDGRIQFDLLVALQVPPVVPIMNSAKPGTCRSISWLAAKSQVQHERKGRCGSSRAEKASRVCFTALD